MTGIIVNGDDLGLSEGVNGGIIEAYRNGILTSASLMVNGPAVRDAVRYAGSEPGLGIGVHLNILRGRPVSGNEKATGLLDERGLFVRSPLNLVLRIITGRVRMQEIEEEFRAQVRKALDFGIKITHLDTEKHIHLFIPVLRCVIRIAKEFNVRAIRCLAPPPFAGRAAGRYRFARPVIDCFSLLGRDILRSSGIKSPDHIFGMFESGGITEEALTGCFAASAGGVGEICCHPGRSTDDVALEMGAFRINHRREAELKALIAPAVKAAALRNKVKFMNYGEL